MGIVGGIIRIAYFITFLTIFILTYMGSLPPRTALASLFPLLLVLSIHYLWMRKREREKERFLFNVGNFFLEHYDEPELRNNVADLLLICGGIAKSRDVRRFLERWKEEPKIRGTMDLSR